MLTPKAPPEPRINGARIFGVRPGHPFLFTIPATGERPMTFGVREFAGGFGGGYGHRPNHGPLDQGGRIHGHLHGREPARQRQGATSKSSAAIPWRSRRTWVGTVGMYGRATSRTQIMRDAADAMVSSGMINHGYQYVNIDDCWAVKPGSTDPSLGGEPRDAQGQGEPQQAFPRHESPDRLHSLERSQGRHLHFARAH